MLGGMSSGLFYSSDHPVQASGPGVVQAGGSGADAPLGADASGPLPCLQSNNSTEEGAKAWQILGGGHKRMAFVLAEEMILMGKRFGVEKLGFLTLTFRDNVQQIREAQRRFNSLNTHVIRPRYQRAIGVWERQRSGRLHFHLVVVLASDIRTSFDFAAIEREDYRSANVFLRSEWAFWRKTAPAYRFGRTELLPVKSTVEGIARYVGKYVSKHIEQREERDKGARVVRFIGYRPGDRRISARFAWNTENGWLWRQKVGAWCKSHGIENLGELQERVGPRWAWRLKEEILATRIDGLVFPSREALDRAEEMEDPSRAARAQAEKILDGSDFVKTYILKPFEALHREKVAA